MWKLAIEDDQGNRTVVNLVRDEYSVGRGEENTVRLTERNISRNHAKLARNGSGWTLSDLNSDNGCFLNGARVSGSQRIEHGDLLQLGDYRLEIIDEGARAVTSGPNAATIPVVPKSQSLVGQPDRLVMLIGPAPGAEFPLVGARLVVGRGEECDLQLNHSSVSRVHAEVHALGDGHYEIIDRDSANGLRVNGVELKRSLLDARDTIELGDVVLKFIPAGEIYRPGLDDVHPSLSQRSERPSPAPGVEAQGRARGVSSGLKVVLGLVLLLGLVGLGMLTLRNRMTPPAQPEPEPAAAAADPTHRALEEAARLLDSGDVQGAHQKINQEIPEADPARTRPEFQRIEARWADELFKAAANQPDAAAKRELLTQILNNASTDAERRKRAASELAALDIAKIDISELPAAAPSASAKPAATKPARPKSSASGEATTAVNAMRENPYLVDATAPVAPASAESEPAPPKTQNPEELATSGDRQKIARAKAILQAKANSGRATEQELRMLKALCRQLGDASCSQ